MPSQSAKVKHVRGYYAHEAASAWLTVASRVDDSAAISEIALKPETFAPSPTGDARTDLEIRSTLAHEMCASAEPRVLRQAYHGKTSRNGYHNAEWARKMVEIGLQPESADGGGKTTGQRITHTIIPASPFEHVAGPFLAGTRYAVGAPTAGSGAPERRSITFPANMTSASATSGTASKGRRGKQAAHALHCPTSGHPWLRAVLPMANVIPTASPCSLGWTCRILACMGVFMKFPPALPDRS